jgi:outer membrane receptor protein involved in Fe transport
MVLPPFKLLNMASSVVAAILASFLCFFSTTVFAQAEVADGVDDDEEVGVEEIIVTGSRLRRRDFNAPSPIQSVDQEQIRNSGQANIEAALNQMPQVIPSQNRTTNNGSDGTAQINLRGLGAQRTLVMLNGRRMAPSGIGTAVDINNLPQVLIDRVEIITGGATTVYGSDAVSGVVNFITRNDFDGFGLDASAYMTERGDSNTYDINLTYGHNFTNGRGNVTVFGAYLDREDLLADQRVLTSVPWSDAWWTPFAGELIESGSPSVPEGAVLFPQFDYGSGASRTIFQADGNPREFIEPDDRYNYQPDNYIQTPLERYAAGFFLNYDLTDRSELYMEGSYMKNRHVARLAPIPAGGFFEFNTDNPLMTPATQQLFATFIPVGPNRVSASVRRRLEELGPRIIENEKDYLRIVTGLRGDIWSDWEYDAWVTYTESDEPERLLNDASRSRFQQGLLVDPLTGQCLDPSNGCAPINWFGAGNISDEAIGFIRVPPLRNETSREQLLASAFVRGRLFDTWDGPVESAFGAEWRRDDGQFEADDQLFTFDTLAYRGSSPVAGVEEVYEVFGEMLIPLADTRPFADFLALEIGGRFSDYKHAGTSNTWKAGIDWRPISSLRFRGMFQRSVRAPNLLEVFQEEAIETFTFASVPGQDPCSAVSDPFAAGNVEKCIATGLPANQIGIFNASPLPADFVFGGNESLKPEKADTLTLGIIIAPDAIPNFQIAVDYFELEVEGGIGALDAVNACFDSANTGDIFCDRISRDSISFNVSEVRETNINRGALRTTGFDTQIIAGFELPAALAIGDSFADLDINIAWTHVRENSSQETVFGTVTDCAGYFGWPCNETGEGEAFPTDRVTANLSYASGDLTAHLTWRWIDKMKNAAPFQSGDFGFPDPVLAVPFAKAKNYLDLGVSYRFSDNVEARLVIANLADTEAPNLADNVLGPNTDAGMYDFYGRSYTLTFSLSY